MIKLREPFSQKVHLHIRQDILQKLWDKYVPVSSQQYGQIELVYLKNAFGDSGKQPEQIQLLLHLLLNNKKMQLNLMQNPMPVKISQKHMENSLQRMERYYTVQLKCSNPMLYRTVKQYFTLLERAQEERGRYQKWQTDYQEIERQKDECRLISLFSEKLREYFAQDSVNVLRNTEREFISSLSETEYQILTEELIWQEKPKILTYFTGWDEAQCENFFEELKKDTDMKQALPLISEMPVKEKLIAAVERLEQREFCLLYHQVMKPEKTDPQMVIWKESKTEMLSQIDRLKPEILQQMWRQIEDITYLPEQELLQNAEKGSPDQSVLQIREQDIQDTETLRTLEKNLLQSLLETEYRTLAERLIWQEKPELISYFKACEKDQCNEIVKKLEKDTDIGHILSSFKKQSAKKKLVSAAYKLEQKEFSLFYWQTADLKDVHPQIVIWKKSRAQMLHLLDELDTESVKKVWMQMETVERVAGNKHVFTEKVLHIQKQIQQEESRNFQEQIAVILKENALENITDIVDIEQLVQNAGSEEYAEKSAGVMQEPEIVFKEREYPVLWDGAYQVLRNLEREQEIRRERIERKQTQAVQIYQDGYRQTFSTGNSLREQQEEPVQTVERIFREQQEEPVQTVERIFREQHQEQLTEEEIHNVYEWSQALLEVHSAEQGAGSFIPDQTQQQELAYMVGQINHYIEQQHGFEEKRILHWREDVSTDERIEKLLLYIRQLDEVQREQFIHYLADMVRLTVANTVARPDRMESTGLPIQSNKQEFVGKLLRTEVRELAGKLLRVEDREYAQRLLQTEDRELIEKLLQVEDREFVERLLQTEDREFAKELLRIEDREFAGKLLQNDDRQLPDVSYRNLWEWGEALLFHPEQEWEDEDILAFPQPEEVLSDEAKQEDVQTQVIRRQIEIAKDRNRLQSLIRQINHQADIQLAYTNIQLRMPQVQTLLHFIEQLDEKQYGVLVKELVQIIKLQKLSHEEPETADAAAVTGEENNQYDASETNAVIVHRKAGSAEQPVQDNVYEAAEKRLQTEDKEFIEKLLQLEDRKLAEELLQAEDREFIEKLLQTEDREFAKELLQVEDRKFARELLQAEDREFAKELLQLEDRKSVEKLLQVEDREFVEKLLRNNDRQFPDVSYRNLWEWGEALLQHPSFDEVTQEDEQIQTVHQQNEIKKNGNHLQSLIRQINRRADVRLAYTDAQLKMPQIQSLLQYIRQLDVRQYGAFVKELAQVTVLQKQLDDAPVTEVPIQDIITPPDTSTALSYPILEQSIQNYEEQRQLELYREIRKVERDIFPRDYAKEHWKYGSGGNDAGDYVQEFQAYEWIPYEAGIKEDSLAAYETSGREYGLSLYEETKKEYEQITTYERKLPGNRYQPQELEYSLQKTSTPEEDYQRIELRMQQENARMKSVQEQMDKKLKEVENQLKKVEGNTKEKEDVRTFAEQVKQQLYEELHVEKLRRGLI